MRGGLRCKVTWLTVDEVWIKASSKPPAYAELAARTQGEQAATTSSKRTATAARFDKPEPAATNSSSSSRRGNTGWQERRVQSYYGDDYVGDHYWFGVDEDAVG